MDPAQAWSPKVFALIVGDEMEDEGRRACRSRTRTIIAFHLEV